jgi:hypothetical protein
MFLLLANLYLLLNEQPTLLLADQQTKDFLPLKNNLPVRKLGCSDERPSTTYPHEDVR